MLVGHADDGIPRRMFVMAVNTVTFMFAGLAVAIVLGSVGWLAAYLIGNPYFEAYTLVLVLYGIKSGARSLSVARHSDFVRSMWQKVRDTASDTQDEQAEPTDEEIEEAVEKVTRFSETFKSGMVKLVLALAYGTVFFSVCTAVIAAGPLVVSPGIAFLAGVGLFIIEVESLERYGAAPIGSVMDWIWVAVVGDEDVIRLADLRLVGRRKPL